jgi:serine/threonine-protein kinase
MPPERWRQIEDLFHAALEREAEARPACLDGACRGDAELRRKVEALLQQDAQSDELLSQPIEKVAGEVLAGDPVDIDFPTRR